MIPILVTTSSFSERVSFDGYDTVYNPFGRRLSEEEVLELIEKYQPTGMIAGVEPLTEKVLRTARKLRVISRCGVGLDSVDMETAKNLGISVYNTPDAPVSAVAEMALALMLAWLRRIPAGDSAMRQGSWLKKKGALLSEKTVGIIGCGRIGSHLAGLLKAFGSTLIGYDPMISSHPECNMVSFDEICEQADIISVHVPLTDKTRYLINAKVLGSLKQSVLVVNTSRGAVIDEKALYEALLKGQIAGAALDVFEQEPYSGNLITLEDRVILSPHQGSSAIESRIRMEQEAVSNLQKGLEISDAIR